MGLVVSIVTARAEVHRRRGRGAARRTPRPPMHIWPVSAPRSQVRDERWGPAERDCQHRLAAAWIHGSRARGAGRHAARWTSQVFGATGQTVVAAPTELSRGPADGWTSRAPPATLAKRLRRRSIQRADDMLTLRRGPEFEGGVPRFHRSARNGSVTEPSRRAAMPRVAPVRQSRI